MNTVSGSLTKSSSTVTGTISGVPAGRNRYLRVDAKDSTGTVIYCDTSSSFTISEYQATTVSITLYPITGSVIVNGTVSDSISIYDTYTIIASYDVPGSGKIRGLAWDGTYLWYADLDGYKIYKLQLRNAN